MQRMPFQRSISKPIMMMGCERVPFYIIALTSGLLIMEGGWIIKAIGLFYFLLMVGIVSFLNSKDPFLFHILYRYYKYEDFYANNALYPSTADDPYL